MASCFLFHGPNARQAALNQAADLGVLMAPPFGDEGLKIAESREIVDLLMTTPVGDGVGTIVVGPMDDLDPHTSDVLLKNLEEFDGTRVQPLLWAHDLGSVGLTLRSRCLEHWAPLVGNPDEENEILQAAGWQLVEAALTGDFCVIPAIVKEHTGKKKKTKSESSDEDESETADVQSTKDDKDRGTKLLVAISDCLSAKLDNPDARQLWEQVRKVAAWKNPTPIEIISSLLRF